MAGRLQHADGDSRGTLHMRAGPGTSSRREGCAGTRHGCRRERRIAVNVTSMLLAAVSIAATHAQASDLFTYDIPARLLYSHHIDDFTVKVRQPGGEWRDLYEYKVTLDQDTHSAASVVQFDFRGEVEVAVRKNNG